MYIHISTSSWVLASSDDLCFLFISLSVLFLSFIFLLQDTPNDLVVVVIETVAADGDSTGDGVTDDGVLDGSIFDGGVAVEAVTVDNDSAASKDGGSVAAGSPTDEKDRCFLK